MNQTARIFEERKTYSPMAIRHFKSFIPEYLYIIMPDDSYKFLKTETVVISVTVKS